LYGTDVDSAREIVSKALIAEKMAVGTSQPLVRGLIFKAYNAAGVIWLIWFV